MRSSRPLSSTTLPAARSSGHRLRSVQKKPRLKVAHTCSSWLAMYTADFLTKSTTLW